MRLIWSDDAIESVDKIGTETDNNSSGKSNMRFTAFCKHPLEFVSKSKISIELDGSTTTNNCQQLQ